MNTDDLKMAAVQAEIDQVFAVVGTFLDRFVAHAAACPESDSDALNNAILAFNSLSHERIAAMLAVAVLRLSKVGEQ